MTRKTRGAALLLFMFMSAALGDGCKKDKQSLVLVTLKLTSGTPDATNLSVTLMATPGSTQNYTLSTLPADTGATLGLYLSGDVTGDVAITAMVTPQAGCTGFHGSGVVTIDTPGVTRPLLITLRATNACPGDGGAAGSGGGTGGTGGSTAGTGGSATAGTGGGATAGTGGGATAGTGGGATAGTGGGGTTGTGGMAGYPSISACRAFPHCVGSCPNTYINAVAVSPNGQLVASAGDDGRVKIWNFDGRTLTATANVLPAFTGYGVAFSPDGTRLAYTSGVTVKTYMVSGWTADTILRGDGSNNDMVGLGFTPDGHHIVSADAIGSAGGDVFVHTVGGSDLPATMMHVARQPASLAVSKIAASDGSVGIAVGTYYGTIAVLTLDATGAFLPQTVLQAATPNAAVWAVGFSADGSLVAQGDEYGIVRFWNYPPTVTTPAGNDITYGGGDIVNAIAFAPNGMYLAVGGGFSNKQLSIYNLSTRAEIDRVTPEGDINSMTFSPNGTAIVAGLDTAGHVIVCN